MGKRLVSFDLVPENLDPPWMLRLQNNQGSYGFLPDLRRLPSLKCLSVPLRTFYHTGTELRLSDVTAFLLLTLEVLWLRETRYLDFAGEFTAPHYP